MLLFSTMLKIARAMTKEKFIELVIEWNNTNKYKDNIIPGVEWNGEKTIRFGNETLWLEIVDYEDKGIIAVRYEKVQADEVVWDTDYIMNFNDMNLAIQLERSYKAETMITNAGFSTPHFISILINAGMLANDNGLEVFNRPLEITAENIDVITDIVTKKKTYALPVIYVSRIRKRIAKGQENIFPVDIGWLSSRLKGVAHVLVEADDLNDNIKTVCGEHCDYNGDIGIFFTSGEYVHKIRRFKKDEKRRKESLEKIIDLLIKHVTIQQLDKMYTWQGVNNALLLDMLNVQNKRREAAESERDKAQNETNDVYAVFDEEISTLNKKIEELTKTNEKFSAEMFAMSSKLSQNMEPPVIVQGYEKELYGGEIKDFILSALSEVQKNTKVGTRKYDVLSDILDKNKYQQLNKSKKEAVKRIFSGYKNVSTTMKQQLEELGFTLTEDGKHYKALYHGDSRYPITIAKTPSDNRTGMNIAHTISEAVF